MKILRSGTANIKNVLSFRFRNMSAFLKKFPIMIRQDALLERELDEVAADYVLRTGSQGQIRDGLKSLNDEGGFPEKESEVFGEALG